MASAANWRIAPSDRTVPVRRAWSALSITVFSLPFLVLAWLAVSAPFFSDAYARTLASALIAQDRGHWEQTAFTHPPVSLALAAAWPPLLPIMSALVGGAVIWRIWRLLQQYNLPLVTQVALLLGLVIGPTFAFLATQSFDEIFLLLLLLIAWIHVRQFGREGTTWDGFFAGLVLGLAFFVHHAAIFYAVLLALVTFAMRLRNNTEPRNQRIQAALASSIVILFPLIAAFMAWGYVNWLMSGQPMALHWAGASAITDTLLDALRVPLYWIVGLLAVRHSYILLYLAPILLISLIRLLGLPYSEPFALITFYMVALLGIAPRVSRHWGWAVALSAIGFLLLDLMVLVYRTPEVAEWRILLTSGTPALSAKRDTVIAQSLRDAAPYSILADASAYRLIAYSGTARPFLLPVDPAFAAALDNPARDVQYILVATNSTGDAIALRYRDHVPRDFQPEAAWPGWLLLRRDGALPLLDSVR